MKTAMIIIVIIGTLLAAFGVFMLIGVLAGSATAPRTGAQEVCSRSWQDAMTSAEKRTARQMCDAMGVRP